MNKLLSVCIPSYNMEQYLRRCVESLLIPSLDKLEILIVNDGSKDHTLAIAREYAQKYPASIVVIDKANGHYGSTVNAALQVAKGNYFRILDADDWFDTEALESLMQKLESCEADCVFTNFMIHDYNKKQEIPIRDKQMRYNTMHHLYEEPLRNIGLNMHQLTYSLRFLKSINYVQTEGVCYTDTEYIFYPLSQAHTFIAYDLYLYQYYLGREDQSMSLSSLKRNISHRWPIIHRMIGDESYKSGNLLATDIRSSILQSLIGSVYEMYICYSDYDYEYDQKLRGFLEEIKSNEPDIYRKLLRLNRHEVIFYVRFWIWFRSFSFPLCHFLFLIRESFKWKK